jgi:hypothetical protein
MWIQGNYSDFRSRYTAFLRDAFPSFKANHREAHRPLPSNAGLRQRASDLVLRRLDCAMLNWATGQLEKNRGIPFQTVRGVFMEGEPAFPGSCIMEKSHIQVAVRDPGCIVGVFRPRA